MNSRFHDESIAGATRQENLEQLQNELALAQYEAQKWKEKYLVEKQRRQKTARDLLDFVVRTEHCPNKSNDFANAELVEKVSSCLDPTANLLSPTLSSFDFDDDSSEGDSDDSRDQSLETLPYLVDATRNESEDDIETTIENFERPNSSSEGGEHLKALLALDLRNRQSLMLHTSSTGGIPGRAGRASTIGSSTEAFGGSLQRDINGKNEHLKHQHLMYRIMYANPTSRDLWHPHKLQNVARSIMFSMHMKKEHIFERFFVTGMTRSGTEQLAGYYKAKLLYEFPNQIKDLRDESVANFCFPRGVPSMICTREQAEAIQGVAVSKWFTEIESLQKHIIEAPTTSGYTFRLTGAKGEVLYGFCIAVMRELATENLAMMDRMTTSPRSSGIPDQVEESSSSLSRKKRGKNLPIMMAPMCFCFTSKFPFYRLYFTLLRMIAETELEQHSLSSAASLDDSEHGADYTEQYEINLKPLLDLAIEFTIYHEETLGVQEQVDSNEQSNLVSIATKLDVTPGDRRAVLSEDATTIIGHNHPVAKSKRLPSQLQKSFSSDDIDNCNSANGWIMDKPMVKSIGSNQPKEYERVKVGDILEAIDSIATASISYEQAQTLLKVGNRPMRLRFRRSISTTQTSSATTKPSKQPRVLSSASVDILHRARRLKMNDPGHWSSARFPTFDFSYQFPKRHSDRWSIGVVLCFLSPDKVVEIMANLLLEKQVVIMSDSPAKVSAVCTALLLLLSPFQWQSTYIPLLPLSLLDFLHSPVPFLVGCHSLSETSEWSDVCFYDIDKDRIVVPAVTRHWGPKSIPNGIELYRLLRKAKERFSALHPFGKPWYELSAEQDTIITLTMQEAEIFLRDMGFDISSQDLAASISGGQSFYDRLQEEVAKEVRNSVYEAYLDEFTQTQLFCQYYESLLQPEAQIAVK